MSIKLSTLFKEKQGVSFPQIEKTEFFEIMNQRQISRLEITLRLIYDNFGECQVKSFRKITSILKTYIFTL